MPSRPKVHCPASQTPRLPTATIMDNAELYRLMSWLSPAYPVGAFCYSHGLEWLVETGVIRDATSLENWLGDLLLLGSGRNDAILFAHAHGAALYCNTKALCHVADYANAVATSAERRLETNAQGKAFFDVTGKTLGRPTLRQLSF